MGYKSDIEIAQSVKPQHILTIAERAGVDQKYIEQYGNYKAKIDLSILKESGRKDGKLVLVTAITPTPAGYPCIAVISILIQIDSKVNNISFVKREMMFGHSEINNTRSCSVFGNNHPYVSAFGNTCDIFNAHSEKSEARLWIACTERFEKTHGIKHFKAD